MGLMELIARMDAASGWEKCWLKARIFETHQRWIGWKCRGHFRNRAYYKAYATLTKNFLVCRRDSNDKRTWCYIWELR